MTAEIRRLLIANRGEIAVRIARTAHDLGIETLAIEAEDERGSAHGAACGAVITLPATGPAAYLDGDRIAALASAQACDAVHPGYGFLSESASFARAVASRGVRFVGPVPDTLDVLGDKARARALARALGIPVLEGTDHETSLGDALEFFVAQGERPVLVKAVAGGGGRGIRLATTRDELKAAHERCASEALRAFGSGAVYVERYVERVRHVEVQVVGDGTGAVLVLGDRECSLQRRRQKLVEIAPVPGLRHDLRERCHEAAQRMAAELRLLSLATFEFLLDIDEREPALHFIEANPRLQVEHTITEAVTGLDLVATQLAIVSGHTLAGLGLTQPPQPRGGAVQLRINAEAVRPDGSVAPASGCIGACRWPGGPGIRVDTHIAAGTEVSGRYDALIAKIIVSASSAAELERRAARALGEAALGGVATNVALLRALVARGGIADGKLDTGHVEREWLSLIDEAKAFEAGRAPASDAPAMAAERHVPQPPLDGAVVAPLPGSIVAIEVSEGASVARGATLAVIESMKMEHIVVAPAAGRIERVMAAARDVVSEGQPLLILIADAVQGEEAGVAVDDGLGRVRPDLQAVMDRHAFTLDAARAEAVAKRHALSMRTVRENVDALFDPGSFIEYGALAVAAQRTRRSLDDLIRNTPADGLVTGIGTVDAATFGAERAATAVMAYDYTVLAGTQGMLNHKKSDRLLDIVDRMNVPLVLFAEGGGGRPGDVDWIGVAGLDVTTFHRYARLSGQVPRVGIVAGRCFAGNAALLGSSDVIIATRNTSVGMGGPAMIEGGGLGVVAPDDVGPVSVQVPNGVIDVLVDDEPAAVSAARQYLSYFRGARSAWTAPDQNRLRGLVPENRLRVYDVRRVVAGLCDDGSVLELRPQFGIGAVTALVRIEGRPFGLIANNPHHLGGAIDADACDKLARFLQLCDAFALPVVSLCDTPGFMVGPQSEKTAMVRKTSRLFVTAAGMETPILTVVLRKGYGLGAQAMAGGTFHAPLFTVSWPTGEFGGMGLEGAVRLGFRKELEAVSGEARDALFKDLVAKSYEKGKAMNMASYLEIDAVIDPAETRRWLLRGLAAWSGSGARRDVSRRRFVDTW